MTESTNYKPKTREIISEMGKGVGRRTNQLFSSLKLKEFGSFFWGVGSIVSTFPYYLPTFVREIRGAFEEIGGKDTTISSNQDSGGLLGFFTGLAAIACQAYLYSENPKYLAIPLATNVVSLGYEIYRKPWTNAKKRLIERHKSLENEVEK